MDAEGDDEELLVTKGDDNELLLVWSRYEWKAEMRRRGKGG
jgi:negative regulator of sigma E activity